MRGINIYYFYDNFEPYEILTPKNGARDFIFSQFDAKQRNHGIEYSLKIRNLL